MSFRGRLAATVLAALTALGVVAPPACADGPGYGGTADRLSVSWDQGPVPLAAGPRGGEAAAARLVVRGLGFRGLSTVRVQVGDGTTRGRADGVGEVVVSVPVAGTGPRVGTSVLAVGRAPSGTTRSLIGAIPPRPTGRGPMDLVLPVALGVLAVAGVGSLLRRLLGRLPGRPPGRPLVAAQAGSNR